LDPDYQYFLEVQRDPDVPGLLVDLHYLEDQHHLDDPDDPVAPDYLGHPVVQYHLDSLEDLYLLGVLGVLEDLDNLGLPEAQ
jgi:hypothetical protein